MQTGFSFNMLAVQDGRPKLLGLKAMLVAYLEHQQIVVRRRTEFELRKAEARAHILEGLRIALITLMQLSPLFVVQKRQKLRRIV